MTGIPHGPSDPFAIFGVAGCGHGRLSDGLALVAERLAPAESLDRRS
jgi:hypothetical protein